jgi:hypothetical protein
MCVLEARQQRLTMQVHLLSHGADQVAQVAITSVADGHDPAIRYCHAAGGATIGCHRGHQPPAATVGRVDGAAREDKIRYLTHRNGSPPSLVSTPRER